METQVQRLAPLTSLTGSRLRIYQEIQSLGYETQLKALIELGFVRLSQNRRYLKEFEGNLERVKNALNERQTKREKKEKSEIEGEEKQKKVKRERKHKNPEQPKKERKPREPKEVKPQVQCVEYEEIPSTIQRVYLDGNNMLFVEGSIRGLTLNRKRKAAEHVIADIAQRHAELCNRFETVLVYDQTSWSLDAKVGSGNQTYSFTVLSASPKYDSSDDALVDWAKNLGHANLRQDSHR
jgi:hypothetical protein